ncbi:AMP-binding protein [Streptacidiphilus griseoplanus]|uniref:AMP-binding protein n=1 Tax=Peterkaempfera griseoplana TaxID=66896 RepID=UPI0007C656A8|nr:AMP-binding protein [Peterkaempfera griseoplana]
MTSDSPTLLPETSGSGPATPRSLQEWFLKGWSCNPQGTAVRIGGSAWSYTELHELALLWAGNLVAGAEEPPRTVGVLATRSIEAYAGILAALYAGATAVPLNPGFPVDRTVRTIREAGLTTVITDQHGLPVLHRLAEDCPDLRFLAPYAEETAKVPLATVAVDRARALSAPASADPSDVAYILFTSGSTGRPKGVPITHANMDHFLVHNHARYGLGTQDVLSQTFDLTFDLVMFDLFMAWGAGATLVSVPAHAFVDLPGFIRREGLTFWFSVPSAIALVRRLGKLTPGSLPTLRWSLFCGEPLRARDAQDWQAAAPGAAVENLYGPTELTIACSTYRWSPDQPTEQFVNGIVPIGEVYDNLRYLLVEDGETQSVEGELCVAGGQAFPGYLDEEDNVDRFHEADGTDWYRTGDRVRKIPGLGLAYLGRVDHQVKIRGYRIDILEIEWHLGRHPAIEQVAVVLVENQGKSELAAYHTGGPVEAAEARALLASAVPEFMIPRHFWHEESLPLNPNGKIDRPRLTAMAHERFPMASASAGATSFPAGG